MAPLPLHVSGEAGYTVSAVARRLGIAPATLRTWDRRYGLSPSLRTAGSHRRYTEVDLDLLERMQSFMRGGMPPADAARAAQAGDATRPSPAPVQSLPSPPQQASQPGPDAGLPRRGLMRAALAMDAAGAAVLLQDSIERYGVVWTWSEVIAPVLRGIGEKYAAGDLTVDGAVVDVEHLLSHVIIRELLRCTDVDHPANPRPVLLASAPEEQHSLPLYALAAALAERGIAARVLGARTPDPALASAVRRTGPVAVFIWAQFQPATDLSAAVPAIRPHAALVVGGPGWREVDLPAGTPYPQDLHEALTVLSAAARVVA